MRTYVITTGLVFGLVVLAHLARAAAEGVHLVMDPFFALATVVSAGLSLWAWRLARRPAQGKDDPKGEIP
jgi:hypothetical protein